MKCRLPQAYTDKYRHKNTGRQPQMTLYDLNKQMVRQMTPMNEELEKEHSEKVLTPFVEQTNNQYYMLMCKELSYFTIFHRNENSEKDFYTTIKELLSEHGTLITACWDNDEQRNTVEYWMKINTPIENNPDYSEIFCFILFPYDQGVVEV